MGEGLFWALFGVFMIILITAAVGHEMDLKDKKIYLDCIEAHEVEHCEGLKP